MKQLWIGTAVLGAALVGAPVLAYAQMPVDIGKRDYVLACAACHGESGLHPSSEVGISFASHI